MTDGPDLDGLRQAQIKLRQYTGEAVVFYTPTGDEWPEGTILDPQTGRPYDPLVQPIASGFASASAQCSVVARPVVGLNDQTAETPVGNIDLTRIVVILDIDDKPVVVDATEFDAKGSHFKITQTDDDGIGSNYRTLVWGERMSDSWS